VAVFTLRRHLDSAGDSRSLGNDKNVVNIHVEIGETRTEDYQAGAPVTREEVSATLMGNKRTSFNIQNQNEITVISYTIYAD